MNNTNSTGCTIDRLHCENCGSTDGEDLDTSDGYTGCCNELLSYSAADCRNHHAR